jgi:site-specific recombinase XerD
MIWQYSTNSDGLHPVKLRVNHKRRRKYYPILIDGKTLFLEKEFYHDIISAPLKDLRREKRKLREAIDDAKSRAKNAIGLATNWGKEPFSFSQFEKVFLGQDAAKNFLDQFDAHLKSIEYYQAGTHRCYKTVYNSFKQYLNGKDIDPADLTVDTLVGYDSFLRDNGLSDTTISIHMRCLRAIYNRIATNEEYLKVKYPFSRAEHDGKYRIPVGAGQKGKTLTQLEIKAFIDGKNVAGDLRKENPIYRAKQLFLFSFFGQGINFKDMALMQYQFVGDKSIEFVRHKTIRTRHIPTKVRISLTEDLKAILVEQGSGRTDKSTYVFGVFDSSKTYTEKEKDRRIMQWIKTTNKWLKKYCELNNLPVVTTYATRHTFASIAKAELPLAMISQMLGHARIETTQIYLGRFEDDENIVGLEKVFKRVKRSV